MAEQATLLKKLPPVAEKTLPKDPSGSEVKAEASGTTELQAEAEISVTPIQVVTYGSFILSFVSLCLLFVVFCPPLFFALFHKPTLKDILIRLNLFFQGSYLKLLFL